MEYRKIIETAIGENTIDGAGVHLKRVLNLNTAEDYTPFLLLDFFDSKNPSDYTKGFPMHPHRGIDTLTYLISGEIEHKDSLGTHGTIKDGEGQWMTAGSGIIHQEMPEAVDHMLGLQLWINLSSDEKMIEPKYNDITDVEEIKENGSVVRVVAGEYNGVKGFNPEHDKIRFLDVKLPPGKTFATNSNRENTAVIFLLEGNASVLGQDVVKNAAIKLGDGESVKIDAGNEGARFIYMEGEPIYEDIAWGGPFVMNTPEEIEEAFSDLRSDSFVKTT